MKPADVYLAGSMAIPLGLVDTDKLRAELTVSYRPMGAEEPLEVQAFEEDSTHIYVPRQFGIDLCNKLEIDFEDRTSLGDEVTFPKVPTPREYQVEVLDELRETFNSYYDFLFRARTGWGKTIGSLILASRLGRSTLVVVDQENLKDQWVDTLVKHFGFAKGDIGIIQGKKCSYVGKAVTIAMVQTASRSELPPEVFDAFGFVIVDETHVIGAPTFSRILLWFSAAYRMGVSATPKRRDGLQKLLDFNLGKVRVYVSDEHDPSAVYVAYHHTVYSAYANKAPKIGRFITEVTEDGSRNLLVAESAAYLYDTGRDCLVLSDRIEQLNDLMNLCYYLGVPAQDVGIYTGYKPTYGYEKDPTPKKRPKNLVKHEGSGDIKPGYYYTPVVLKLISKRCKKTDLERVKTTSALIFATYGKFSKGVDEPRLSGGVDASPRSRSEQEQGRILRPLDGKLKPIWITIADWNSYRSLFALAGRIPDYVKNNATVSIWSLEKGKQPCDAIDLRLETHERVKLLKSAQTETLSEGLYTIVTQKPQTGRGVLPARLTRPTVLRSSRVGSSAMAKRAK